MGTIWPVSLKYDQGLDVMILHVPVYDKRPSEDEGGGRWSDEDEENELEELQTEIHIFFIQENKHVISWCFSLLSFNLCQIWSIYFRASEYVFGPVKFS